MALVEAECDVVVVDTAHRHSKGVLDTVAAIKRENNYIRCWWVMRRRPTAPRR